MQTTVPTPVSERAAARILAGSPNLAAKISHADLTDVMTSAMALIGIDLEPMGTCPDGRSWCTGIPSDHADPREHIHKGPEQSMNGAYGYEVMAAYLVQFDDGEPELAFVGAGDWTELNLEQTDELIEHTAAHLERLRLLRAQLAQFTSGAGR